MGKSNILIKSLVMYVVGIAILGALLFGSAGTFRFPNAWLFLGVFFISDLFILVYLGITDRELLAKRIRFDEKEKAQRIFNIIYRLMSFSLMAYSGLNFRFGWSLMLMKYSIIAAAFIPAGFSISLLVMKQNRYASRTIEIQDNQKLIDTGLYSVVRHPMYVSALLIFVPTPMVLGSLYAFLAGLILMPAVLVFRILNEEKVLEKELPGYAEYKMKVKYRLIPFIW